MAKIKIRRKETLQFSSPACLEIAQVQVLGAVPYALHNE